MRSSYIPCRRWVLEQWLAMQKGVHPRIPAKDVIVEIHQEELIYFHGGHTFIKIRTIGGLHLELLCPGPNAAIHIQVDIAPLIGD